MAPKTKSSKAKSTKVYKARTKPKRSPKQGMLVISRRIPSIGFSASPTTAGVFTVTNAAVFKWSSSVAYPSVCNGANFYDVPFALEVNLNDLQNSADIQNISDKYKITGGSIKFINSGTNYYSGAPVPYIQYIRDQDDSDVPTIIQLNQKMGLKTKTFNQTGMASISLSPRPALLSYNTALSSGYVVPGKAPFLNTNFPIVPHYCLKGILRNLYAPGVAAAMSTIQMDITLNVTAKDLQ